MKRAWAAGWILAAACSLPEPDLSGKGCRDGICPLGYQCVEALCQRAAGGPASPPDGGSPADVGTAADSGSPADAGPRVEKFQVLTVSDDTDDALWTGAAGAPDHETLWVDEGGIAIEVASNDEAIAGLRFQLPVAQGAEILDARLELFRVTGNASEDGTMRVQMWNAIDVPPFDGAHLHPPEFHGSGGLSEAIGGWRAAWGTPVGSPDLSRLLQPLVNRLDWAPGAAVGFVIKSEALGPGAWAGFEDSAARDGHPPLLKLRFRE